MIRRGMRSVAGTWLAGLLVLLPLALTLAVLAWIVGVVNRLIGPGSAVGQLFAKLGYRFSDNDVLAYVVGTLLLLGAIYALGVIAQAGLKQPLQQLTRGILRRIPVVGSLYNVADRVVGLLDQEKEADIGAMSPVWCFFGGDGAAVLALAPNPEPIHIDGRPYLAVLVPTAPVPFGGGLLYVPSAWIRPANIGVEKLTAIYVSMGLTPPPPPEQVRATPSADPR